MERKKKRQDRKLKVYQQIITLLLLVPILGIIIEVFIRAEGGVTFTYLARIYFCIMLVCLLAILYLDTLIKTETVVTHNIITKENLRIFYTYGIAKVIIIVSLILIVILLVPFTGSVWAIIARFFSILLIISIGIHFLMEQEKKV